jgi:WD40 repeat protein
MRVIALLVLSLPAFCQQTLSSPNQPQSTAMEPSLVLQVGHTSNIDAIAWRPDGKLLASGSDDGTVKLWDPSSGQLLRTLARHTNYVRSIAFSPNGHILASSSWDGNIFLWNVDTGSLLATLTHGAKVESIAFTPDGATLASTGDDGRLIYWNPDTGSVRRVVVEKGESLDKVAFTPDGRTVVLLGSEKVFVRDANTGKLRLILTTPAHAPKRLTLALTISHDGNRVAVGFTSRNDGESPLQHFILIWNLSSGALLGTIDGQAGGNSVSALAFSSDDKRLFAGTWEGHILRIQPETGKTELDLKIWPSMASSVALSPDGRHIAASGGDPRDADLRFSKAGTETIGIKILDASSGALIRSLSGSSNTPTWVTFSASGKLMIVESRDGRVKLWDTREGVLRTSFEGLPKGLGGLTAISPDEQTLVTGVLDGTKTVLAVRDLTARKPPVLLHGTRFGCLQSSAFNADGSRIVASDGCDFPEHVHVWDTDGKPILEITAKAPAGAAGAVFSPDSLKVAVAGTVYWHIDLHDARSGQYLSTLKGAFSPMLFLDDKTLLTGSETPAVKQWDISTGKLLRSFTHNNIAETFALSPDRRVLATAGRGNRIELWNWVTGASIRTLFSESASIASVAFSPDSHLLAAAGSDTSVMLWSADSGNLLLRMYGWPDGGWLAVAPDGLFDGTSAALRNVSWRPPNSNQVVPLDAFYNDFFHPGLLGEITSGSRPKAEVDIATAVQVPGLRAMLAGKVAHMEMHGTHAVVCFEQEPGVALNVGPADQRVVFPPVNGYGPGTTPTCKYEKALSIPDSIQASVIERLTNGKPDIVSTPWDGLLSGNENSVLHILTIGVSQYPSVSGFDPLPYAAPSAKGIEEFFRTQPPDARKGYSAIHVWDGLYDQAATRDALRQRFTQMAATVTEDDVVFLYIAGHGTVAPGTEMFYFVPVDGVDSDLRGSAFDTAMIAEALRNLPARRIVLIVDACQSGGAIDALARIGAVKAAVEERRAQQEVSKPDHQHGVGVHLIAATMPLSYAVGVGENQSALAATLLAQFRESAGAAITALGVSRFLSDRLPRASQAATGFRQVPLAQDIGLDFPVTLQ